MESWLPAEIDAPRPSDGPSGGPFDGPSEEDPRAAPAHELYRRQRQNARRHAARGEATKALINIRHDPVMGAVLRALESHDSARGPVLAALRAGRAAEFDARLVRLLAGRLGRPEGPATFQAMIKAGVHVDPGLLELIQHDQQTAPALAGYLQWTSDNAVQGVCHPAALTGRNAPNWLQAPETGRPTVELPPVCHAVLDAALAHAPAAVLGKMTVLAAASCQPAVLSALLAAPATPRATLPLLRAAIHGALVNKTSVALEIVLNHVAPLAGDDVAAFGRFLEVGLREYRGVGAAVGAPLFRHGHLSHFPDPQHNAIAIVVGAIRAGHLGGDEVMETTTAPRRAILFRLAHRGDVPFDRYSRWLDAIEHPPRAAVATQTDAYVVEPVFDDPYEDNSDVNADDDEGGVSVHASDLGDYDDAPDDVPDDYADPPSDAHLPKESPEDQVLRLLGNWPEFFNDQ